LAWIKPEASPGFEDGGRADTKEMWRTRKRGRRGRKRRRSMLVKPLEEGLGEVVLDGGGGGVV
jgi:hypothetical protein